MLHYIPGAGGFCADDLGICRSAACAAALDRIHMVPTRSQEQNGPAEQHSPKNEKKPGGRQATGRVLLSQEYVAHLPDALRGSVKTI
jgi:hypothetical protein